MVGGDGDASPPAVWGVWGAGQGCTISPHFPHSVQPRAGVVGEQPAREESPCFSSCTQLWQLSQNIIDWHHIPRDCPLSPALPAGEIPGMPVLCWCISPDSQIEIGIETGEKGGSIRAHLRWVSSLKPLRVTCECPNGPFSIRGLTDACSCGWAVLW